MAASAPSRVAVGSVTVAPSTSVVKPATGGVAVAFGHDAGGAQRRRPALHRIQGAPLRDGHQRRAVSGPAPPASRAADAVADATALAGRP